MSQKPGGLVSAKLLLLFLAAGPFTLANCDKAPTQHPEKRFNVVIIVSDALRQDALGCYGGPANTPNIDWLAGNGVRFENSYSTSPWTSPSSVSMFSGNYATSYGYTIAKSSQDPRPKREIEYIDLPRIFVPDEELMFVETLIELGYTAGMQIENVNASLHNNLQGFNLIPQDPPDELIADSINAITGGLLADSWTSTPGYQASLNFLGYMLAVGPEDNFCLLHWILDPHAPYDPAEKFTARINFDDSKLPVPRNYYSKAKYNRAKRSLVEQAFIKMLYIAEIESVDERVGFVIAMLRHKNMLDNTYIVFTSDHGEQFGEHGLHGHGGHGLGCHYYEGLIRVPLIIFGPNLPKGKTIKDSVTLLDLMPTLKDLLGVKYKDNMQGRSYGPLIFENARRDGFLFFDDIQEHDQIDALIENDFKLIAHRDGKHELYELVSDHHELTNFAPRIPQRADAMLEKINQMRSENNQRRKKNMELLSDNVDQLSSDEKKKIIEKLKALGYVN